VQASPLETLVMPGEVVQGHAKVEKQCERCHEPFSQSVQNKLCRDCHEDVDHDVQRGQGFHGRLKDIEQRQCKSCHTDHKGRDARIILLDRDTFDHAHTDFALKGEHQKVQCAGCHKPRAKFREAPGLCVDCHKADDPHRGKLGEKCADCHDEKSWKKEQFDHGKTQFPLLGKHKDVTCQTCHVDPAYKDTPKECVACHRINDVHAGKLGAKCESCHSVNDWKKPKFDHDRDTHFRLTGRHASTACAGCHKGNAFKEKLGTTCVACHKKDDEHKGHNGTECQDCHVTSSWTRSSFDHDKTRFPLRNRHEKVACEGCHKGSLVKDKLKLDCVSCHEKDDVHKKQEGPQCEQCHNDQGWNVRVTFSHELTRFPLIGLHAITPCGECHLKSSFKDAEQDCVACHKQDDTHKGTLGGRCEQCHNPNGWQFWNFDHGKRSDFALTGAHDTLQCKACHKDPVVGDKLELPAACSDCHQKDDVHRGSYGQNCERCHQTTRFNELKSSLR
jgi:hypothetical protein